MTAFFIATAAIKNPEKFQQYAQKAGPTFAPHQGELVLRGKHEGNLAGASEHQSVGIIKFPDQESLHAWYQSDAYQSLVPLRDEAADITISTYSVPAG